MVRHYLRCSKSAVTRERDSGHVEGIAGRERSTRVVHGLEPFDHVVNFIHESLVLISKSPRSRKGLVSHTRVIEHSLWVLETPFFEYGVSRGFLYSVLVLISCDWPLYQSLLSLHPQFDLDRELDLALYLVFIVVGVVHSLLLGIQGTIIDFIIVIEDT